MLRFCFDEFICYLELCLIFYLKLINMGFNKKRAFYFIYLYRNIKSYCNIIKIYLRYAVYNCFTKSEILIDYFYSSKKKRKIFLDCYEREKFLSV